MLFTMPGEEFLGARARLDTTPRPDDRFHSIVTGDRVDSPVARYLGHAELWWVLCDYNDI